MNPEEALNKAKIGLITKSPFIAALSMQLKHYFNDNIPTARTNGLVVEYNTEFFMSLTPKMRVFLVAHEVDHVAYMHSLRFPKNGNAKYWNYAGDYVINWARVQEGFEMPDVGLLDERFAGKSTEQVYKILMQEKPPMENCEILLDLGGSEEGTANDDGEMPPLTPLQQEEVKQKVARAITVAKMSASGAGSIPGEIEIALQDLLNPVLPWDQILRRHLTAYAKSRQTFARPNRRYMPQYMPTLRSRTLGDVVWAFDTSGSISDEETREQLSEAVYARRVYSPRSLTILDCDTRIHHIHEVKPRDDIMKLKFSGRGGTSFKPVEEYCDKHKPDLLIYFTDLDVADHHNITTKKPYHIIWVNHGRNNLRGRVGETIQYTRRENLRS